MTANTARDAVIAAIAASITTLAPWGYHISNARRIKLVRNVGIGDSMSTESIVIDYSYNGTILSAQRAQQIGNGNVVRTRLDRERTGKRAIVLDWIAQTTFHDIATVCADIALNHHITAWEAHRHFVQQMPAMDIARRAIDINQRNADQGA